MSDWQSALTHLGIRIAIYLVLPSAYLGGRLAWRSFKQINSEDWPVIQGKCTFAGITTEKDKLCELKILYAYQLPAEKFITCGEFHKDFFDRNQANQWAQALREKDIPVRYHPNKPEKSILLASDLEFIVKQQGERTN